MSQFDLPPASLQATAELDDVFNHLDIDELFSLQHGASVTACMGKEDEYRFVVTLSQTTQKMRWLNVGNSKALSAFSRILAPQVRHHLSLAAGGPVDVNTACYIILRGGAMEEEC